MNIRNTLALVLAASLPAAAQTSFTYQGELRSGGAASAGTHDFRFVLYSAASGGTALGAAVCLDNVAVADGRFLAELDFGAQFNGSARYLEVQVRADTGLGCGDTTGFVTLTPRQAITGAPQAGYAASAGTANSAATAGSATNASQLNGQPGSFYTSAANLTGTVPSSALGGTYTNAVSLMNASNAFGGSGAGLINLNAGSLSSGTVPDVRLSSNVVLLSAGQTVTGPKWFADSILRVRDVGGTYSVQFRALGFTSNRTFVLPDATGTAITTGNLGAITGVGTVTGGTWNGDPIAAAYGGTGFTTYPSGSLLFGASSSLSRLSIGAAGTFLKSTGAAPAWGAIGSSDLPVPMFLESTATPFEGRTSSGNGAGVRGIMTHPTSNLAAGVLGVAEGENGLGVQGIANNFSGSGTGVQGIADGAGGTAVSGLARNAGGNTYGVVGRSFSPTLGIGVYGAVGSSATILPGVGVMGYTHTGQAAMAAIADGEDTKGLWVRQDSPLGDTVSIDAENSSSAGIGLRVRNHATSGLTYTVMAQNRSPESGIGLYGAVSDSFSTGILPGTGVMGYTDTGEAAVVAMAEGATTRGLWALNTAATGARRAVYAEVISPSGVAVLGHAGGAGVGVRGESTTGNAVVAISPQQDALYAQTSTSGKSSVFGYTGTAGANGGYFNSAAGTGTGRGVVGQSNSGSGHGVYSIGAMTATGTKAFQIDHPLDPANKYLNHYCAEGPEPLNVYRGTVQLDSTGVAVVELPAYFAEINRDPSYTLTAIGAPMPGLYIAQEVRDGRFAIAGGVPLARVSWRIEAVRNDAYVRAHGAPVETEKPGAERGRYLHPELHGRPASEGIFYRADLPEAAASEGAEAMSAAPAAGR